MINATSPFPWNVPAPQGQWVHRAETLKISRLSHPTK